MLEVTLPVLAAIVLGGILWTIGFIRAVKRQPIKDRLARYCERKR